MAGADRPELVQVIKGLVASSAPSKEKERRAQLPVPARLSSHLTRPTARRTARLTLAVTLVVCIVVVCFVLVLLVLVLVGRVLRGRRTQRDD